MSVLVFIATTVGLYLLNGVTLMLLWGWFMVPTFGLPVISLVQAIGIGMVIGFLTFQHIPRNKEEEKEMIALALLIPVLTIAFGWGFHLFM